MRLFTLFLIIPFSMLPLGSGVAKELLTLEKALTIAKRNNPQFRIAQKDIEIARAKFLQAKAIANPNVAFRIGGLPHWEKTDPMGAHPTPERFEVSQRELIVSGEITQEIELWGTRSLRKRETHENIKVAEYKTDSTWRETVLKITVSFYDLLLQKKLLEIGRENFAIGQRFLGDTELKYKQNKVPFSDVLRSRLELVQLKKELVEHEENLKIAKNSFNILLGRSPHYSFGIGETLPNYSSRDFLLSLEKSIEKAFQMRPELLMMAHEVKSAQFDLKNSKRSRLPKPSFTFWGEKDGPDKDLGVGIRFDLPLLYRQKGEVLEAKNRLEQQAIARAYFKQKVEQEVRNAYRRLIKISQTLEVSQEGLKTSAELIRRTMQNYRDGRTSFLKFLETLKTVNKFKEDYFSTIAFWYQQKAFLDKAIGRNF